ncbi:MAG: tetratricopeptide repeat protein [Cyanobacteriota bacterium]|nr:tetratricopeptide repeat protein [Cyanobacteriota bacterium]
MEQARGEVEQGRIGAALEQLRVGLRQDPTQARAWHLLGELLSQWGDVEAAAEALTQAAAWDPTNLTCRSQLGHLFRNISQPELAIHWHQEALRLRPDSLILRLNLAFVQPLVPTSVAQIQALRERTENELTAIEHDIDRLKHYPNQISTCHPYYLIYDNSNDRELLQRYGRLLAKAFGDRSPNPLPVRPTNPGQGSGKPRLGFLSGFFYNHSHARAFEGLIHQLDRDLFEVVIIHLPSSPSDAVSLRLNSYCQEVIHLPHGFEESSAVLRQLDLALLFFTDLGMHPWMGMLACRRHAPIQVTGWGVPQTSGIATIDAYLSGDAVEPEDGDEHYSEVLIRLPGLPCSYPRALIQAPPRPRAWFLLPEKEPLFGCLQLLEKIHPEFDTVLEQLALRVPQAWFVFIESKTSQLTEIFLERLARTAPTARARLILLSRLERPDFIALSACIDVVLDPFHFCSGITLFETLHTGTPIVTLEGRFLRSRFVAGAYNVIGVVQPPVAHSAREYVEVAAGLLTNPEARKQLAEEIGQKARSHLYDRLDMVRGFEAFALAAIQRGIVRGPWTPGLRP